MKRFLLSLCLLPALLSCEKSAPVEITGSFTVTIPAVPADASGCVQLKWSAGDKVVLSNCREDVCFENGEMLPSSNAECFAVTPAMIGPDGLVIGFDPVIPGSDRYVVLTARDFSDVVCIRKDGTVELAPFSEGKDLNYAGTALSTDGKFVLQGLNNMFSVNILDKRVKYFDVSAGYTSYELVLDQVPVTYYFPIPVDEDLSDGIYVYSYDESCEKIYSEHHADLSFHPYGLVEFGDFFDPKDADIDIIREIIRGNDTVEATYNLEGEILKRYLDEVQYDDDYSYTKIKDYVRDGNEQATIRPAYVSLEGAKNAKKLYLVSDDYDIQSRTVIGMDRLAVYDLVPGRRYRYGLVSIDAVSGKEVVVKKGCIATEGRVRYIKTSSCMHNVRDVGGWEGLDGKHIKYGILFRGSEVQNIDKDLNRYEQKDYEALINHLGIDFDLDFREDSEVSYTKVSPLGIEYLRIPLSAYDSIVEKASRQGPFKKAILKFIKNAREGRVTYVHCQGGADRTGTFVFYLEGLLGVSDSDLCKDYEITSFYYHKERNDPERYLPMIKALRKKYGNSCTIGEAIHRSALDMGITEENINELRDLMLE